MQSLIYHEEDFGSHCNLEGCPPKEVESLENVKAQTENVPLREQNLKKKSAAQKRFLWHTASHFTF